MILCVYVYVFVCVSVQMSGSLMIKTLGKDGAVAGGRRPLSLGVSQRPPSPCDATDALL